ncbi:hypothetical protein O6P37_15925 [Mycobacterium sp. CPCC 205372]|uniref:Conserved hypothetical protein CHP02391 domain-containing protein n=1 Tax=Mycobacterium hippophais TaxID=3016340 RepID=A0ABT4PUV6_9MYCO|nr:TIGR02391 family protein [Mycobacterium hippophais]MCZ8380357.1 hypothetical protein [Mycobacterium hippophais]
MDYEWMRERLTDFDDTVKTWAGEHVDDELAARCWRKMLRAEPTIKRILATLDPQLADQFDLNSRHGPMMSINLVQRAYGILDDINEWSVRLRPQAPALAADQFHPWVWRAAQTYWDSQHYRAAVNAAATAINAHTQTKVGRRDVSDDDLMNQVFTEKAKEGQPYLRLPGDPEADRTLRSRNNALRPFAAGCFAGIRNPSVHEHEGDWPQQKALEYLASLSVLARWIDECAVHYGE